MKGLKVERARPSNAIDIYALLKEGAKDGLIFGDPNERELQTYYFSSLMDELAAPNHIWFIAKRGRGYLGFVHAVLIPGRWDGVYTALVDQVFVTKNRRKNGIGKKLLDEMRKELVNLGIKQLDFLCGDNQLEYWSKERSAKRVQNLMRIEL